MRLCLVLLAFVVLVAPRAFVLADSPASCSCVLSLDGATTGAKDLGTSYGSTAINSDSTCKAACMQYATDSSTSTSTYVYSRSTYTAAVTTTADQQAAATAANTATFETPNLAVTIPGLSFSQILNNNGVLTVNFIGEYIGAVYRYALGAAAIFAIIMIMIGGVQYMLGGANPEMVGQAKSRMTNAVTGLILILSAYVILYTVNPSLTSFKALQISSVPTIDFSAISGADEGKGTAFGPPCTAIVAAAQAAKACKIPGGISSPTGGAPQCGYHFNVGGKSGASKIDPSDWATVNMADYTAAFGTPILAPFDGVVSYHAGLAGHAGSCGNEIDIQATSGEVLTICHAKDFTDSNNSYASSRSVKRGDVIGHSGGACCSTNTEQVPTGGFWLPAASICTASGTACTDPTKNESCSCQTISQSGNVTGPHVHVQMPQILACLST